MSERSDMPTVLPAPLPEEQGKGGGPERRVQTRFPFTASADVYELRSQTRVNGRCSDLSVGGVLRRYAFSARSWRGRANSPGARFARV
jgi:hypothetical protein